MLSLSLSLPPSLSLSLTHILSPPPSMHARTHAQSHTRLLQVTDITYNLFTSFSILFKNPERN